VRRIAMSGTANDHPLGSAFAIAEKLSPSWIFPS
jgi:hypothetical protein